MPWIGSGRTAEWHWSTPSTTCCQPSISSATSMGAFGSRSSRPASPSSGLGLTTSCTRPTFPHPRRPRPSGLAQYVRYNTSRNLPPPVSDVAVGWPRDLAQLAAEARAVIETAMDAGVHLVATCPTYGAGPSEFALGKVLRQLN